MVVGSLAGRKGDAGAEVDIRTGLDAGAACKSDNDQGRGTKWSDGRGGGLERGDGGRWRCKGWETSGSQTPTKTGIVRWADGLPGLGRNGPPLRVNRRGNDRGRLRPCMNGGTPCERSTNVDAGDDGAREHALFHEYWHDLYAADAEGTAQSVADRTIFCKGLVP